MLFFFSLRRSLIILLRFENPFALSFKHNYVQVDKIMAARVLVFTLINKGGLQCSPGPGECVRPVQLARLRGKKTKTTRVRIAEWGCRMIIRSERIKIKQSVSLILTEFLKHLKAIIPEVEEAHLGDKNSKTPIFHRQSLILFISA